ncbi:MAG: Holliday junction resolvase RuvX [Candidatus Peribacteraceae bacterium]|nr:Holliday junction resolvase RuvX [Candidatus Peribacteraceae bacterium]
MKLLALDFGEKRIGIAVGDSKIGVAAARDFLVNDGDALTNLVELVEQENIEKILFGLPLGFREETEQTHQARTFAESLDAKVAVPLEFIDERFTTKLAEKNLQNANLNSREQKNLVDSESARIILQEYLDSKF